MCSAILNSTQELTLSVFRKAIPVMPPECYVIRQQNIHITAGVYPPAIKDSGLGLSTVYNIVMDHNGFIDVVSEFGSGTASNAYLPIVDNEHLYQISCKNRVRTGRSISDKIQETGLFTGFFIKLLHIHVLVSNFYQFV